MTAYTAHEKRKAVAREIEWRKAVYPERVRLGRMSASEARYQLAIFASILEDYQKQEEGERLL